MFLSFSDVFTPLFHLLVSVFGPNFVNIAHIYASLGTSVFVYKSFVQNSQALFYWTHIQDNTDVRHTGEKVLLKSQYI